MYIIYKATYINIIYLKVRNSHIHVLFKIRVDRNLKTNVKFKKLSQFTNVTMSVVAVKI